jgi:PIN domain nuclease of toxin-antitoxin system
VLPLSTEVAVESCHLPGEFHRDPADQIITATARVHALTLLTADQRLQAYGHVRTLWE